MKKFMITVCAVFAYFGGNSQTSYSLEQCIEVALENNLNVFQAATQAQSDAVRFKQAKLNKLPSINASVGHGINQGRSIDPFSNSYINSQLGYGNYGVNAGVVLFSGGALSNAVQRDKFTADASQMDLRQAKDNLTIQIILAYLNVLTQQDILVQTQNQIDLTEQQVERLTKLDKDGNIAPSQLSDLKGQLAGDQLTLINARNLLETLKLSLSKLMNISYDKHIQLERIPIMANGFVENPESIYANAVQSFAAVKASELKVKSAEKDVDVNQSKLWPTLRLSLNVNTNYSSAAAANNIVGSSTNASTDFIRFGDTQYPVYKTSNLYESDNIPYNRQITGNFFSSIGLNLSIPIFNGFEQRNQIKLSKLSVKQNEMAFKTVKTELEQAIDEAYIHYNSALERLNTLTLQVEAFESSFKAAEIRFTEGVGNSIDYLTAKNNMERAKLNHITAEYDVMLRLKVLEFYKGY